MQRFAERVDRQESDPAEQDRTPKHTVCSTGRVSHKIKSKIQKRPKIKGIKKCNCFTVFLRPDDVHKEKNELESEKWLSDLQFYLDKIW